MSERKLGMYETTETYITPRLPNRAHTAGQLHENEGSYNVCLVRAVPTIKRPHCRNCQDVGYVFLSFCTAGPFQHIPAHGKGEKVTYFNGGQGVGKGWFIVRETIQYQCPNCQGKPEDLEYAAEEGDDVPWFVDE